MSIITVRGLGNLFGWLVKGGIALFNPFLYPNVTPDSFPECDIEQVRVSSLY